MGERSVPVTVEEGYASAKSLFCQYEARDVGYICIHCPDTTAGAYIKHLLRYISIRPTRVTLALTIGASLTGARVSSPSRSRVKEWCLEKL